MEWYLSLLYIHSVSEKLIEKLKEKKRKKEWAEIKIQDIQTSRNPFINSVEIWSPVATISHQAGKISCRLRQM